LAIWLHGTLEISAIILAGGAGLTLGRGLLFPGTLSRRIAFLRSAQRGLKIMLGITPVFILAAIIESFATRYTDAPNLLRLLIILSSLAFILGYYVWYPWKKSLAGLDDDLDKLKLPVDDNLPIEFDEVKSTGTLFSDTFRLFKKLGSSLVLIAIVSAAVLSLYFLYINKNNDMLPLVSGDWFLVNLNRYFTFHQINEGFWLNLLLFSLVVGTVLYGFNKVYGNQKIRLAKWLSLLVILFLWQLLFLIPESWVWWALIIFTPFVFLLIVGVFDYSHKLNPERIITLVFTKIGQTLMLTFLILLVSIILFLVVYTPLMWFYVSIIQMNIDISDSYYTLLVVGIITWVLTFVFFTITALMLCGAIILYFNFSEVKYAEGLLRRVLNIKAKKLAYGLEREN
jgi:hypothetical protein